jgi:outer membrane lipoprotein-sorting protein
LAKRWQFAAWLTSFLCAFALPAVCAPQITLDTVLAKMDATASTFRSAQADFTWTFFNNVINAVDTTQKGEIFFRKDGSDVRMAAKVSPPDPEQVFFSGGRVEVYREKPGTVDVYDASAHREEAETLLVLGFGSSGNEMRKSFDVSYGGEEKIDDLETAKLELVPKSEAIKNHFPQIILWIDPQRGISVQQKLIAGNGDYRLAQYSNIRINQKIPDKVFKLKTSGTTKTITH